jgi:DNA-binding MarR family transcriptional regulator
MPDDESSPRWLSEEEQAGWVGTVGLMWLLPAPLDAQLQRDSGLTLFEYMVMSRLSMSERLAMRMSELAAVTASRPSRLSNVVGRLEKRGWITRGPDPCDGRGTVATLTDDGFEQVRRAAPGHVGAVRRYVVDRLTPAQLQALAEIGEVVTQAVRGDPCAEHPDA